MEFIMATTAKLVQKRKNADGFRKKNNKDEKKK